MLAALLVALSFGAVPGQAAPDDPPPSEEELLTIPGPTAEEAGVAGNDPFDIVPELPDTFKVTGEDYFIFYDRAAETLTYDGGIGVETDNGIQLFAQKAVVDLKNKLVRVTGDVSIYQGPVLHRGDSAIFYYESRRLDAAGLRSGMDPILLEAGQFRMEEQDGRQVFVGENAGVTTHDYEDPSYWVRADKTTVIPGEKVIFRNMKFYAGDIPIFYLPYLSQPLNRELGYHFIPGARTTWGPFLLNRYGIMLGGKKNPETGEQKDAWLLSQWHVDLLAKRGVGLGVDLLDTRLDDNPNLGWLKAYYLNDQDPNFDRADEKRSGVDENRYRIQLRNRLELDHLIPSGHTYLDANLTLLSDRYYLEDFDSSTFRTAPNPDNTLSLVHQRGRNLLTLWTRGRPNDFYQSDTRLPEISLDQVRAPFFNTPIIHEGQYIFGIYHEDIASFRRPGLRAERADLPAGDPRIKEIDYLLDGIGYTRFLTWQELSLPLMVDDFLNIVPRAGLGYTNYSNVNGPPDSTSRTHLYAGIDASVKFSKEFPDVQNKALGLDGLMHIFQPYANASWVATNEMDPSFGRIDRVTASTRPRPLEVGRFTAVDGIEDWAIIRLGVRNRLLTRRDEGTHEWLTMDTYFDWFQEDPEFDREFSNLYNDIRFRPVPWMDFSLETQFPLLGKEGDFTEIAASMRYMPLEDLELTVRHRYLNDHPILENSIRFEYEAFGRLNEDWGLGFLHRWEFEDGTLELQEYAVHRTLNSWAITLGLFTRDNGSDDEFGAAIGFTLREFPSFSLPLNLVTD